LPLPLMGICLVIGKNVPVTWGCYIACYGQFRTVQNCLRPHGCPNDFGEFWKVPKADPVDHPSPDNVNRIYD